MGVISTNSSGAYTTYSTYPLKVKLSASVNGFSYSFWIKPSVAPVVLGGGGNGMVFIGDTSSAFVAEFTWDWNGSAYLAAAYVANSPATYPVVADPSPPHDNAWHNYVFTYDSSAHLRLYRDGSLVAGPVLNPNPLNTSFTEYVTALATGYAPGGSFAQTNLNNGMAELAIWNTCLNTTDVSNLFAGTLPTSVQRAFLQCYWALYGNLSSQFDFSGNGVQGTLYSGGTIGISDASNSFAPSRPAFPTIIVPHTNPVTPPNRMKVISSNANPTVGGGGPTPPSHGQGFPIG